jgi:uncharacterized protein YjiS (DUF1127 family)
MPSALIAIFRFWGERQRQRRALGELDDRLLQDIGVSHDAAATEAMLPFWK